MVYHKFTLSILKAFVLSMVLFQVIKTGFNLSGIYLLYPYFIATTLIFVSYPGVLFSWRMKYISNIIVLLLPLIFIGSLIFFYQMVVLEESSFNILYSIRFYYGVFILFFSFVIFLFWMNIRIQTIQEWILSLIETVLVVSFILTAIEFCGIMFGVDPGIFWWIRKDHLNDIIRLQRESIDSAAALRAYGLTANSAILGGFTAFLMAYYYALVVNTIRFRNILILLLGIITILMSKSGTGYVTFALFLLLPLKRYIKNLSKFRASIFSLFFFIIVGTLLISTIDFYRFSDDYISRFSELLSNTITFASTIVGDDLGKLLMGSMNLTKYGGEEQFQGQSEISYYDFTFIAFFIEFGLLGILLYIFILFALIRLAYNNESHYARWSFVILLIGTFHYAVSFWICSQVMMAIILAADIYIRQHSNRHLFSTDITKQQKIQRVAM